MSNYQQLAEKLIEKIGADFNAKIWQKNDKYRVYYRYRRDVTLYSDYNDGWSLKCYINDCGQSPKWYQSQKNQAFEFAKEFHQLLIGSTYIDEPATNEDCNEWANKVKLMLDK